MTQPSIPETNETLAKCLCPNCPSKPDDGQPGLYCARGVSPVRARTTGCRCTDCAVYQTHGLQEGYFCAVEDELWSRVREHARTRQERESDEAGGSPGE